MKFCFICDITLPEESDSCYECGRLAFEYSDEVAERIDHLLEDDDDNT